jgi:glycerate dehydrogenase
LKIVVLDSLPLDADHDLDWSPLTSYGVVDRFESTSPTETAERIAGAAAVFTNKVRMGAPEMDAAGGSLRFIGVLATGYDVVDVAAARARGITVANVPGYSGAFTAQTTIALLLELCQQAGRHAEAVRAGEWQRRAIWSFWLSPQIELEGRTLAVLGLGAIGVRVARIAEALGMHVIIGKMPDRPDRVSERWPRLPLDEALTQADAITLHVPLAPATRGLINTGRLARMRHGALLVNAARGLVVDEAAVARALHSGHLGGYAADVVTTEPPAANNPLLTAPNCLLTPHLGWSSKPARERLLAISAENLRRYLSGMPQNLVS